MRPRSRTGRSAVACTGSSAASTRSGVRTRDASAGSWRPTAGRRARAPVVSHRQCGAPCGRPRSHPHSLPVHVSVPGTGGVRRRGGLVVHRRAGAVPRRLARPQLPRHPRHRARRDDHRHRARASASTGSTPRSARPTSSTLIDPRRLRDLGRRAASTDRAPLASVARSIATRSSSATRLSSVCSCRSRCAAGLGKPVTRSLPQLPPRRLLVRGARAGRRDGRAPLPPDAGAAEPRPAARPGPRGGGAGASALQPLAGQVRARDGSSRSCRPWPPGCATAVGAAA